MDQNTKILVMKISIALMQKKEDIDLKNGLLQRMSENDAKVLKYILDTDMTIIEDFNKLNGILKEENDRLKRSKLFSGEKLNYIEKNHIN